MSPPASLCIRIHTLPPACVCPFFTARSSKWGVHWNVHRVAVAVIKPSGGGGGGGWAGGGYEHASRQGGEVIPATDETSFLCHSIEQGLLVPSKEPFGSQATLRE